MTMLGLVWLLMIVCLIVLNVLLRRLASTLGMGESGLRLVLNLLILFALAGATAYYVLAWDKTSIELAEDSLIVNKGITKRMIAYTNVSSVFVQQNSLGKSYNFGTIQINFLAGEQALTMHHIENVEDLSIELKKRSTLSKQAVTLVG